MSELDHPILETAAELAATDIFDESILDALPLGVVVLDRFGTVVKYNRFEEQLARRQRRDVIGRSFFEDVARCTNVPQVAGIFRQHIGANALDHDLEWSFDLPFHPRPRDVRLLLRSFLLGDAPFGILLIEDITLRKELEREREQVLKVFVHDLNNPLQGVLGYANLIRLGGLGTLENPKLLEAVRSIESSAERMRGMVQATLGRLRGENKKTLVNLHALALSSLANLLPDARKKGVDLSYQGRHLEQAEFPNEAMAVAGVTDLLARLVDNLLSNALKYARSAIKVDLRRREGVIELTVADDGRGIAPELHTKIFTEGFQAPDSLPGHGLGLFGVARTVREHQGAISVESEPGHGARFKVRLPAADWP